MSETETTTSSAAPDAVQDEVKVFRFTFQKEKSVMASLYIPAKTEEEAKAFFKTQEDGGDLAYDLDTNVIQERSERDAEWSDWELLSVEQEAEKVDGQYLDYDYDDDVVPVLTENEDED